MSIEIFHKDARACLEALFVINQTLTENSEGLRYSEVYARIYDNLQAIEPPTPLDYHFHSQLTD